MSKATKVLKNWLNLKETQAIRLWYKNDDKKTDIIIYSSDSVIATNNEVLINPWSRMSKYIVPGDFLQIGKLYTRDIVTIHESALLEMEVISKTMGEHYEFEKLLEYELRNPDKDFTVTE